MISDTVQCRTEEGTRVHGKEEGIGFNGRVREVPSEKIIDEQS